MRSTESDVTTKKFDSAHPLLGGNKAGECYDCYYGALNWTSHVILTPDKGPTQLPLVVGVFPMERFVSHCEFEDVQGNFNHINYTHFPSAALGLCD